MLYFSPCPSPSSYFICLLPPPKVHTISVLLDIFEIFANFLFSKTCFFCNFDSSQKSRENCPQSSWGIKIVSQPVLLNLSETKLFSVFTILVFRKHRFFCNLGNFAKLVPHVRKTQKSFRSWIREISLNEIFSKIQLTSIVLSFYSILTPASRWNTKKNFTKSWISVELTSSKP